MACGTFLDSSVLPGPCSFPPGRVPSKAKFHVSVGHSTVMADLTFFGLPDGAGTARGAALSAMIANLTAMASSGTPMAFDAARDYLYQVWGVGGRGQRAAGGGESAGRKW